MRDARLLFPGPETASEELFREPEALIGESFGSIAATDASELFMCPAHVSSDQ